MPEFSADFNADFNFAGALVLIEEALQGYLEGHAGVSALVSNRVYPSMLRQNSTLPAVTYTRISGEHDYVHRGPIGRARPRFQIDAWGSTYANVKSVAEQVKLAMMAFIGTFSGVVVQDTKARGEIDLFEPDTRIYRVSATYEVTHTEGIT